MSFLRDRKFLVVVIPLILQGCSNSSAPKGGAVPLSPGSGAAAGGTSTLQATSVVPHFDTAGISTNFNQTAQSTPTAPADFQTKMLVVKSTPYYRSLWLDLTQDIWSSFDKFSASFGGAVTSALGQNVGGYILQFAANPSPYTVPQVSIWQPMGRPSVVPGTSDTLTFYLLGHTGAAALSMPGTPAMIVAPNTENAQVKAGQVQPIQPPSDYKVVYTHTSDWAANFITQMKAAFTELNGGHPPPIELMTQWATISGGLAGSTMNNSNLYQTDINGQGGSGSPTNYTTGQINTAFNLLIQMQSVAIWQPVCPAGYNYLGYAITNGKMAKPFDENDFSQIEDQTNGVVQGRGAAVTNMSGKAAMYCVQSTYLVPGKLGTPIFTNSEVTLFSVVANDSNGLAPTNMFIAIPGQITQAVLNQTKVWVFNRNQVIVMDENTDTVVGGSPPTTSAATSTATQTN